MGRPAPSSSDSDSAAPAPIAAKRAGAASAAARDHHAGDGVAHVAHDGRVEKHFQVLPAEDGR